jgi:transglutaminase-like putative cysteine protease
MYTYLFISTRLYKLVSFILIITTLCSSIHLSGIPVAQAASISEVNSSQVQSLPNALLPKVTSELPGVGTLGPNGLLDGILVSADTPQATPQQGITARFNPLSISVIQSTYMSTENIANSVVVTFTVTNNQLPANLPNLSISTTNMLTNTNAITDALKAISAINPYKDPNTIHNVLLVDTFISDAIVITSSPVPDRSERQYAWNLGDIPPLGVVTATLQLHTPTTVIDFTSLDIGATAWGTFQGRDINTQARQIILAPDNITGDPLGDWLRLTVDADKYDEYMLTQAAQLGQDSLRMFEYVRSLRYESYKGSLRGTRGTLWSEAGNSLDKASLLIAMLRASAVPARYRHGLLDKELAQALILSMFQVPTRVIGHVPPGTQVSDPTNDPKLLSETQDHWWVEAYLPGLGWQDLDPSFYNASVGQRFVLDGHILTDGTDRIVEVPDSLRHKVTISVKVEHYHPLNAGSSGLSYTYPLATIFNALELVGEPVTLGHFVSDDINAGLFYAVQHTYTPVVSSGLRHALVYCSVGTPLTDTGKLCPGLPNSKTRWTASGWPVSIPTSLTY